MSVIEYKEGQHPGAFVGLRVTRSVNGQTRNRWLSTRSKGVRLSGSRIRELRREAHELDAHWKEEQQESRDRRRPTATGIRGITANYVVDHSIHRSTYVPIFRVQVTPTGVRQEKVFRIPRLGYERAWREAVRFYARAHGFRQWAHLRRMQPDSAQFARIRKQMKRNGHSIPVDRIPTTGNRDSG